MPDYSWRVSSRSVIDLARGGGGDRSGGTIPVSC
jgi:hypothetical protein